jgi:hypothetical protein
MHNEQHTFLYCVVAKTTNNDAIINDLLSTFPAIQTNNRYREVQKKDPRDIPSTDPFVDNGVKFGAMFHLIKLLESEQDTITLNFDGEVYLADQHDPSEFYAQMEIIRNTFYL